MFSLPAPWRASAAAALTAALLALPTLTPGALAHDTYVQYQIIVYVHSVEDLDCLDGCTNADFYSKLTIDGDTTTSAYIRDEANITPDWRKRAGRSSLDMVDRFVPVGISIWDSDNGPNAWIDPDDHVDITPGGGRNLDLLVNFTDPNDPDLSGTLIDANTGAELAVFRPFDSIDGRPYGWTSTPRQRPNDAYLTTRGTSSDRAAIEYRVRIHRVPDFVISRITELASGSTAVEVFNGGGPGTVTSVACSNASGTRRTDASTNLAAASRTTVTVPIARPTSCTVTGENRYGWSEPHTDNNTRISQ
jgi:hypothetical protein